MMFHHLVAQLLFLTKWAHPGILMVVAFLMTRVQSPNWDDYKKLGKVLTMINPRPRVNPGGIQCWFG